MTAVSADVPSAVETSTVRKLRARIVPFIFVLFLIAFIDRINIGFAALTMNKELDISSQQFGFLAGIFFGYFTFELPRNLLLHRIGARVWMARILITWEVVAILTGFVQKVSHLYVLRFLLGMAEAGCFPGMVLYLTYWFRQRQLGYPLAWLCAANPVARIVGGRLQGSSWITFIGLGSAAGGSFWFSTVFLPCWVVLRHTTFCPHDQPRRNF